MISADLAIGATFLGNKPPKVKPKLVPTDRPPAQKNQGLAVFFENRKKVKSPSEISLTTTAEI
jgi:hypothetical protein